MKNVEAAEAAKPLGAVRSLWELGRVLDMGVITDEGFAFIERTPFESVRRQPRLLEK
jgi:hypothetical protein